MLVIFVAPSDFCSEIFFSEIPSESERNRNSDRNTSVNPNSEKNFPINFRNDFRKSEYLQNFNIYSEKGVKIKHVRYKIKCFVKCKSENFKKNECNMLFIT